MALSGSWRSLMCTLRFGCGLQGNVGVFDAVVLSRTAFQPLEDFDGLLDSRLDHVTFWKRRDSARVPERCRGIR